MATMLGWLRLAAAWASRRNRVTNASLEAKLGVEDLDGDATIQEAVLSLVDIGHSAPGEVTDEPIPVGKNALLHTGAKEYRRDPVMAGLAGVIS